MPGMTDAETAGYIRHHLKLAGRSDTLFSDDADHPDPPTRPRLPPRGQQPRRSALVAAYAGNKAIVDESAARAAITENSE